MKLAAVFLTLMLGPATVLGQRAPAPTAPVQPPLVGSLAGHASWPEADPKDVRSVDAVVAALYDVISGPKGQPRDWRRLRSLFLPDGRLIPARADRNLHRSDAVVLTIEGYIERSSSRMMEEGFFERGVHNEVQEFGNIAHVWSTFESRHAPSDAKPFARGINSIQLLKSGGRYYIVEVLWDSETPLSPVPQQYLPR